MTHALAMTLHILSAVVWVGGMFFAYMALRPVAASQLEPPQRLQLWVGVFARFFPWVWASIIALVASGFWIILNVYTSMNASPLFVHIMLGLGILMILIFMHVFFAPYRRLKQAVNAQDWPTAGSKLAQIRILIAINLALGLTVVVIASAGRLLA